jgi:Lon protease-like protein
MSDDLESRMRSALRPVAPSAEFSEKLLAQVTRRHAVPSKRPPLASRWRPLAWWFSASLAASLVLAVGVHQHLQQQRLQQSGIEARREVLEALRVTSQKLNLAYEAVKSQSTSLSDEQSGA